MFFLCNRVWWRQLMSKHVTSGNIYAGMQVNHSGQWEAWSLWQSGIVPILLITHENGASGCCEDWLFCSPCYFNRDLQWNVFIPTEAAVQASSSLIGLRSCSLLRVLRRQRPKTARADSLRHFSASFSFILANSACLFPDIPMYSLTVAQGRKKKVGKKS